MPNWRKILTSGSDAALNSLDIATDLSVGGVLNDNLSQSGTSGQILSSTGTGIEWIDSLAEGASDLIISGKNVTGTTIPKGMPLYFTASGVSGNVVGVMPADAGNPDRMPAGGVAGESLGAGVEGDVYIYGFINGVDTSAFGSGDNVYVAVGGGYTNEKPTGSALIQKLGNVEKVDATNGSGVIQGPSWFNDLPNWEEGKIKVGVSDGQPVTSSFIHLDESNGRLGIGTDTPQYPLHHQSSASYGILANFGNGLSDGITIWDGKYYAGSPLSSAIGLSYADSSALTIVKTKPYGGISDDDYIQFANKLYLEYTTDDNEGVTGFYNNINSSNQATSSAQIRGIFNQVEMDDGEYTNWTIGLLNSTFTHGTANLSTAYGVYNEFLIGRYGTAGGTVTTGYAAYNFINIGNSATVTNAYSSYNTTEGADLSGVTFTNYAAIVGDNPVAASNNTLLLLGTGTIPSGDYGIYNTSTYDNYINGNVGIGTTTPSQKLDVVGKIALNDGGNSVFVGTDAGLNDDASDNRNVGVGYQVLYSNTTGFYNTANGYQALFSNTEGNYNTATGYQALTFNTIGYQNTATGYTALYSNTTGAENTATGYTALYSNTTGTRNTANGFHALYSNTTGTRNTATGNRALYSDTTGERNTAAGYQALYSNTTGNYNTATGYLAGTYTNTGLYATVVNESIFIGYDARPNADSQTNQIVIGYQGRGLGSNTAVIGNTSIVTTRLHGNVGIGTDVPSAELDVVGKIHLNDGGNSVFVGTNAGFLDDGTDNKNVGVGYTALRLNTTGAYNTAAGYAALYSNTIGTNNTANGYYALYANTTGTNNTANGLFSLRLNTTGNYNTANGATALNSNTSGLRNTASGYQAGRYTNAGAEVTVTNNSVFIGYDTRANADSQTNQIVIGSEARGLGSNTAVLGNSSIVTTRLQGKVGIGTDVPSEELDVVGSGTVAVFRNTSESGADTGIAIRGARNGTVDGVTTYINFLNFDDNNGGEHYLGRIYGSMASSGGNDGTLTLQSYNGSSFVTGLNIDENGNVGIGTTTPANKLDVNGGIDATTLNTGQGDNELYAMNQNVQTTDSPTFKNLTVSTTDFANPRLLISAEEPFLGGTYPELYMRVDNNGSVSNNSTISSINFEATYTDPTYQFYFNLPSPYDWFSYPYHSLAKIQVETGIEIPGSGHESIFKIDMWNNLFNTYNTVLSIDSTTETAAFGGNINVSDIYVNDQIIKTGDTNTYMQFHAADQWRVVTGGTERIEANSSGLLVTGQISTGIGYTELYLMNQNVRTTDSVTFGNITNSGVYTANTGSTRDKIRLWNDSLYLIGMQAGHTFGALNDYAMTFQMSNTDDRGFWWGDASHTVSQGAMSLTTIGELTLAKSIRVGWGESDTVTATSPLEVYGSSGTVMSVDGSTGRLFELTDSMSGSLFSVNDVSGLPILEVFSDNSINMGTFGSEELAIRSGKVGIGTTSPNGRLHVDGGGSDLYLNTTKNGTTNAWLTTFLGDSTSALLWKSGNTMLMGTATDLGTTGFTSYMSFSPSSNLVTVTRIEGESGLHVPVISKTAAYTLAAGDEGAYIRVNSASAVNVTVPLDGMVAFPVGTVITISQTGAGQVTVVPIALGPILNGDKKTAGQYKGLQIVKVDSDVWDVIGGVP